jgi:hypothetical protein
MRKLALEENRRADGRACDEVRPISSRAGLLPCTHGSALFTRGETQTIAVTTLGALRLLPTECYSLLPGGDRVWCQRPSRSRLQDCSVRMLCQMLCGMPIHVSHARACEVVTCLACLLVSRQ